MDENAAYEITIAEKLEQLTVPDKVDAIWARIETQLDIDMPTDEGPDEPPPASPPAGSGLWNIAGIAIFIAALIATIYFTNKKTNTNNNSINSPNDSATTIITLPGNTTDKPPPSDLKSSSPQQQSRPDTSASLSFPLPVSKDSLFSTGEDKTLAPVAYSVAHNILTNPIINPPADTAKKKSRGVKGITDSDYRIVPDTKDSTK